MRIIKVPWLTGNILECFNQSDLIRNKIFHEISERLLFHIKSEENFEITKLEKIFIATKIWIKFSFHQIKDLITKKNLILPEIRKIFLNSQNILHNVQPHSISLPEFSFVPFINSNGHSIHAPATSKQVSIQLKHFSTHTWMENFSDSCLIYNRKLFAFNHQS